MGIAFMPRSAGAPVRHGEVGPSPASPCTRVDKRQLAQQRPRDGKQHTRPVVNDVHQNSGPDPPREDDE